MFAVPVRFVTSAAVLATIVTAAVQPSSAAPLAQTEARVLCVKMYGGATSAPCINPNAYTTIQAAVDKAQSGDEIRIAQGTYATDGPATQNSMVMISGKSVKLVGGFTAKNWVTPNVAAKTIIDGGNTYHGITAQGADVELAYLTVTRSVAKDDGSYDAGHGGAIQAKNTSLSLHNVIVSNSQASKDGGGIAADTVVMTDTQIINNRADGGGGGIMASEVKMLRSTVDSNTARGIVSDSPAFGGGVLAWQSLSAVDSVITQNTAKYGGGVLAGDTLIERTRIEHNGAEYGGGLWVDSSDGKIFNSVISNNTASKHGGGLYSALNIADIGGTMFSNNVAGIAGDAIYFNKAFALLRNVTIASVERAPHEAIHAEGGRTLTLFDTLITNHAVGVAFTNGSAPYGDYNAFFNNGVDHTVDGVAQPLPFAKLVTADPQFVDPAANDFHLQPTSPLIDVGDPKRDFFIYPVRSDPRDIDGEPVPWGGRADIGADEVVGTPHVFAPLVAQ